MGTALCTGLYADPATGLQDFKTGQGFQAARQWGNAVKQYLKCLQDDPKAYWAYKALGTVYYQAGDHRGALAYYQRYLALNPSDSATQAFAGRLRAESGVAAPATSAGAAAGAQAQPAQAKSNSHGGFGIRAEGDYVLNNGADLVALYTQPGVTAATSGANGTGYGLGLDFTTNGGFMTGIDYMDGPSRACSLSLNGGTLSSKVAIANQTFGLDAGWRLGFGTHFMVEPNLGLDYMLTTMTINSNSVCTASGFSAWPKLRAEAVWGCLGVGLSAGYLWAQLSPVKNSSGWSLQQYSSSGASSTWVMNNGGLSFGLYAAYHFTPPL
ncbi:MAG TPA: tetratricopeptide repeat protein [bacterium]|nr:tetratricopeptide repeat protein [bacterium]